MIIILEGPRGTGKSTLARAFVEPLKELGYVPEIFKAERGTNPYYDMRDTLIRLQTETRSNPHKAVIIDRFHLTEFVMRMADGTVPRGKLAHDMVNLSYALEMVGAWVVVLSAFEPDRQARVAKRDDGRGDEPRAVLEAWDYATYFLQDDARRLTFNNTFFVSTDSTTPERLAKMLLLRFKLRAEANLKK